MSTNKSNVEKAAEASAKQAIASKPGTPGQKPSAEFSRYMQTEAVPASLYRHLLAGIVGGDEQVLEAATPFVVDLMRRFKPRDAVEEMLPAQMLLSHLRTARLSLVAFEQTNIKWAAMMHEAADRAANTFRRQMLALDDYRRPPRHNSFTAIGQANIARQQVVQNRNPENGKATNEQGSGAGGTGQRPEGPKRLPAVAGGAGVAPAVGGAGEAVAGEHRAEDGGRQAAGQRQRAAAR